MVAAISRKSRSNMNIILLVSHYANIYGKYRPLYKRGFVNPPLSLAYLAAALIKAGHSVKIIDGEAENLSAAAIISRCRDFDPQLIGLTATSVDFNLCRQMAERLKKDLPAVPVILGGTHLNIFGAQVLKENPVFDFGCIGDGEDLLVELAAALSEASVNLKDIPGLIYRHGEEVIQNRHRPLETQIDRYPFPARHLLNNELYYRSVPHRGYQVTAAVMSSRGCPYSCVYCAVENIYGGARLRLRSAANVLDELEEIVNHFGIRHLAFNDDCLTVDRQRVLELCRGIKERRLHFTWEGLSRADLLDKELVQAMKATGFVRISIGIESGNPRILKVLRKGETLEQIRQGIRIAKEAGIVTRGSAIIGSPYETRETIADTFRFVNGLKELDQVVINILQPYPGTRVREMVLNGEGGCRFLGSRENNENLQRFGRALIEVNGLTPRHLINLQRSGFLRFYLRPQAIYNNLRLCGLRPFISDSLGFLRSMVGY
jgi:radical SAM superfamily enzyme YgiQ (UPF0313 family)